MVRRAAFGLFLVLLLACDRTPKAGADSRSSDPPPVIAPAPAVVPPSFNGTPVAPVAQFADAAASLEAQPPVDQAKGYEATGQLWMARLVLEQKALGDTGTKEERELLARICDAQHDPSCLDACGAKLGRKLKLDAGSSHGAEGASGIAGRDHVEPDTDLARARDHVLKKQYEPARKLLEPKLLAGSASREEIRMLRTICDKQGDRMCVALCDTKLK